jgi:hypothetical protein
VPLSAVADNEASEWTPQSVVNSSTNFRENLLFLASIDLKMASRKRGRVAARMGNSSCETAAERSMRQKADKTLQYLADSDSEDDGIRQKFSLEEKLASTKFPQYLQYFVKELPGDQVTLALFQK